MILQALNNYYIRKQAATDGTLPPLGFEYVPVSYLIVLEEDGTFVGFEPRYRIEKNRHVGQPFLLPQAVKRAAGIIADILWGKKEYVLGVQTPLENTDDPQKQGKARSAYNKKAKRLAAQSMAFTNIVKELYEQTSEPKLYAVNKFLANLNLESLSNAEYFDEILSNDSNLSFRIRNDEKLVAQFPSVIEQITRYKDGSNKPKSTCLVTGELSTPQRLHAALKGVKDAHSAGGNIVSFNKDSFCSYGKRKQDPNNAPVSESVAFGYTTALNSLLERDSLQHFQVGKTSTVCWAISRVADAIPLEYTLPGLITERDDPDRRTEQLSNLFKSVRNGAYLKDDGNDAFYVLGLAANDARISVRIWQHGTVASFSEAIVRYFTELDIDGRDKFGHPTIFRLLCSTAALGKAENINPALERALINAALGPAPYPQAVLNETLRRARTERDVNYYRAALIKAWLIRNNKKELDVSLNPDYDATGYQLGRLFATLEKLQEAANPGLNATIRDRYFSAASSAPVTVFSTLMRLSNHHLKKLEGGMPVYFEKQLGEIITRLPAAPFPARLSLESQGEFAIGYYQQRQHFFKSKKDKSEVEFYT